MSQIFYIFCHACYVPFNKSNFKSPNITLYFDTPIESPSCNTDLQLSFDSDHYEYKESYMNPTYDYVLSFKDDIYSSSSSAIKMCGLFDSNHNRIEIKNVTNGLYNDVLLSTLIQFLVNKNNKSIIYCSFCRNACSNETTVPNNVALEFGNDSNENHDLDDMDISDMDFGNLDDDIHPDMFAGRKQKSVKLKHKRKMSRRKMVKQKRKMSRRTRKYRKYSTKK
jgi:hypothetical protein